MVTSGRPVPHCCMERLVGQRQYPGLREGKVMTHTTKMQRTAMAGAAGGADAGRHARQRRLWAESRKADRAVHLEAQGRVRAALRRAREGLLQGRGPRRGSSPKAMARRTCSRRWPPATRSSAMGRGRRRAGGEPGAAGQGRRPLPDQRADGRDRLPRDAAQGAEGPRGQAARDLGRRDLRRHDPPVHTDQQRRPRQDPAASRWTPRRAPCSSSRARST